ncbi:MAG: hypothetical protein EZS28_046546, partial [Streblomastix strix]
QIKKINTLDVDQLRLEISFIMTVFKEIDNLSKEEETWMTEAEKWSHIQDTNSSFKITRFERRSSSSAHGVTGSQGWEWGKDWSRQ